MARILTLCEYIAEIGGLRLFRGQYDTIGASDLRAMNADLWHRNRPFQKKLVREENGVCPDDAAHSCFEAGYFLTRPDVTEFLNAIDDDMRGMHIYRADDYEELERMAIQELNDMDAATAEKSPRLEGRSIPVDSAARHGFNGETVYLYQTPFVTKKGRTGFSLYAKAFRAGERKHAWHHVFASEEAREAAVSEFLAGELV